MRKEQNSDIEDLEFFKNRIASAVLSKARAVVKSFEEDKKANSRIAKIGLLVFVIALPTLLVVNYIKEELVVPDLILTAKVVDLAEAQLNSNTDREEYFLTVKLGTGESVFAYTNAEGYAVLNLGDSVKVGFYKESLIRKAGAADARR